MGNASDTNQRGRVLDSTTLVPIGLILAMGGLVFAAGAWATRIDSRLTRIEEILRELKSDTWSATDHELWVRDFKAANPTVVIPPGVRAR